MSPGRRAFTVLPALVVALVPALAACSSGGSSSSSSSSSAPSTSSASATGSTARTESSAEGSESPGSEPTQKSNFPANANPDGGPPQTGATADPPGQMHVATLRIGEHPGYSRLVIELSTAGIPNWEVRYSEPTGPGGGPVTIQGDKFLRVVLHTSADYGVQTTSDVTGSGLIPEAKTTGFFEGDEEVLVGIKGGIKPFAAFTLTDPGRIVIDVREP